jgi:hypothetical protein
MIDPTIKFIRDLYSYNKELIMNSVEQNKKVSSYIKLVTEKEIENLELEKTKNFWKAMTFTSIIINIGVGIVLCLA